MLKQKEAMGTFLALVVTVIALLIVGVILFGLISQWF